MFVEAIGLRKIPDGSSRLIECPSAQNRRARMLVAKLVGPLRNISGHIECAERAGAGGKRIRVGWRAHSSPMVRWRNRPVIPLISPRIEPPVGALRGVLPFPIVRQPFSSP